MKNNTITSERLKKCRIAAGYKKQEDVAKILNVQRQIISYYETGERKPNIDDLVKLAKLYNTSTDYLLGLSNVATTDTELKAVCEYTGLSEDALASLKILTSQEDKKYLINFLLSNYLTAVESAEQALKELKQK